VYTTLPQPSTTVSIAAWVKDGDNNPKQIIVASTPGNYEDDAAGGIRLLINSNAIMFDNNTAIVGGGASATPGRGVKLSTLNGWAQTNWALVVATIDSNDSNKWKVYY